MNPDITAVQVRAHYILAAARVSRTKQSLAGARGGYRVSALDLRFTHAVTLPPVAGGAAHAPARDTHPCAPAPQSGSQHACAAAAGERLRGPSERVSGGREDRGTGN
jgi:hypothetical protein